jgi:hypothetical protein
MKPRMQPNVCELAHHGNAIHGLWFHPLGHTGGNCHAVGVVCASPFILLRSAHDEAVEGKEEAGKDQDGDALMDTP